TKWDEMRKKHIPTGKIVPLGPDELANALMKAETKAKRRATLSICGLGMMDESEIETVEGAQPVVIDDVPDQPGGFEQNHEGRETKAESSRSLPPKSVTAPKNKPETQQSKQPGNQSPNATEKGVYRLVDMKTGVSPGGVTFAHLIVQNERTGKTETVLAKWPDRLDSTTYIKNDTRFERELVVENGFKIV